MMKFTGRLIAFLSVSTIAFAGVNAVPEIDASTGAAALTLISGGLLLLRSRRAKK